MKTETVDQETGEITMADLYVESPKNNVPAVATKDFAVLNSDQGSEPPSSASFPHIAKAISEVMTALIPVERAGKHKHFGFRYPTMGDILIELTPKMGAAGLAIIPAEVGDPAFVDGKYVKQKYMFTILHSSGEVWAYPTKWTGLSLAVSESGKFDDKCLAKTAVSARKAFLQALFNIPTEDVNQQDPDRGDNDGPGKSAPRQPPKPTVAPKPVLGAKPHLLPLAGMEMSHWVTLYIAYLSACVSKEDLIQWDKLNDQYLTVISNKDKAAYDRIVQTTQQREKELAPKKPGPPPPPKTAQPAEDTDVALVTGGVTPPGEMVWEDPPADVPDGQAWLRDFAGALSGCTTPQELEEIRKTVGLPAKGKVSQEEWEQGGVLLQAAKNRISLEE